MWNMNQNQVRSLIHCQATNEEERKCNQIVAEEYAYCRKRHPKSNDSYETEAASTVDEHLTVMRQCVK